MKLVFLILCALVVFLLTPGLISGSDKGSGSLVVSAATTPTQVVAVSTSSPALTLEEETETVLKQLTKSDRQVGDLILKETDTYLIRWLISNQQMMIEVKKAPFQDGKQQATTWLIDQGFRIDGLCTLDIFYFASREVLPAIQTGDSAVPGCK